MFVPLILAKLAVRLPSGAQAFIRKGKQFSFPIWLVSLFLISAKASDFLRNENTGSLTILLYIALISLGICVVNFALGALIGGRQYRREASQALGQKNLSFVIWIALTFINPLVAMGPMFYILYHHLYNSWLIYRFEKATHSRLINRRRNLMKKANFGFMGLGVMGHMLALNMERNGFRVAGYDLDAEKVKAFGTKYPGKNLLACNTLDEFLDVLERPRRIMMMVPAGKVVDAAIASIKDALEPGDLLIDGGNTHFPDTERRSKELEAKGIVYIGTGVSGGEQGALWGPSIMPGGQDEAWELVKPIFEAISAKVEGEACVTHIGPRGAGHYVKMVHNGIEYGDMQLDRRSVRHPASRAGIEQRRIA